MNKHILLFVAAIALLSSCSPSVTRMQQYPKMYEEKPATILVMPPINNTNKAEAKEYFYSSLSKPLIEKGYYVVSPFLAMDLLRQESAYDSELFVEGPLTSFKNVFGADAALFTIINKWEKKSAASQIRVGVTYILRSTATGEKLFEREGDLTVDFSSGGNSLLSMIADMVSTSLTDHVVAARKCNAYVLSDLPVGQYSPKHLEDGNEVAGKYLVKGKVK